METRVIAAIFIVVLAAGCTQLEDTGHNNGGSTVSQGLEIVEFRTTDHTLTPGQETRVVLRLRNHHRNEVSFEDISLYNTGFLKNLDQGDSISQLCSPTSLQAAREDFSPEMECTWTLKAPDNAAGFESRGISINLNLAYNSKLSNRKQAFKVSFKPLGEIDRRDQLSHTFSNTEVKMEVSTESPAPVDGSIMDIRLRTLGNGRVASNYSMSYSPSAVFPGCIAEKQEVAPVAGETTRVSCEVVPGTSGSVTRNLIISTSYKYVKSPSLDIEVVKP